MKAISKLRRVLRLGPVVAVAAVLPLAGLASPASAALVAGGVVTGTVFSSGVPLFENPNPPNVPNTNPCANTTYNFTTTAITGAFVVARPGNPTDLTAAVGTVNVTANGTGTDCPSTGSGTVNLTSCSGSATLDVDVDVTVPPPPNPEVSVQNGVTVTCNLSGTFTRVGPTVIVLLTGSITVNNPEDGTSATTPTTVVVAALFVPTATAPCGPNTCATQAAFSGVFAGAGV